MSVSPSRACDIAIAALRCRYGEAAISITLSGVVVKPADAVGSSGSEVCGAYDIDTAGGGDDGGIDSAGAEAAVSLTRVCGSTLSVLWLCGIAIASLRYRYRMCAVRGSGEARD